MDVRFLDMYWLYFVKTLVIQKIRQNVLTCWYDIIAYLDPHSWRFIFKREDFHILCKDLFHVESWPRKCVSRIRERWFILSLVLKNVVATFKETSDLLQNICAEISRFSWSL